MILVKFFWRMYFFLLIFLFFKISYPFKLNGMKDFLDIALMLISIMGLFGLSFNKKIFFKKFWQLYFITLVTWDIFYHFSASYFQTYGFNYGEIVFMLILLIPLYLGLFIYGFFTFDTTSYKEIG